MNYMGLCMKLQEKGGRVCYKLTVSKLIKRADLLSEGVRCGLDMRKPGWDILRISHSGFRLKRRSSAAITTNLHALCYIPHEGT